MADNFDNNFADEFPEGAELMEDSAPVAPAHETYTLNNGTQGSRAAFIREKFLDDNMSRKDIAEKYGFAYRIVYSATVNLSNSAEAPQRGRAPSAATIKVTADQKVVTFDEEGKCFVNGELYEGDVDELGELQEVARNEWIKAQVEAGVSRGDLANMLGMSYGVVYSITKDQEGTRARAEITLDDGTKISRAEYIRMQYAAGVSRGEIAKALGVPYPVVWQATKTEKTAADHLAECIAELEAFADKIVDEAAFGEIIAALKQVRLKDEEPTEEAAE